MSGKAEAAVDKVFVKEMLEAFGREALEAAIDTKWAGKHICYFKELDSTNARAKQEADNGAAEGTLVVTDMQTAGRGRRGRSWNSPAGVNLYFTLILKPVYQPDKAAMVTLVMALAVAEGISLTCGMEAEIKWPNDVVVNGKKVCGILTEMNVEHGQIQCVAVGVGVNVGLQEFPPEIADKAASLEAECGKPVSRAALAANILKAFEKYYESFLQELSLSCIRDKYNRRLVNRDREVRVLDPQGEFQGIARGINEFGELLVERDDGSVTMVFAGEVSVRGIYGYTV